MLAALIHELGHIAALEVCGVKLKKIRFSAAGVLIDSDRESLSYLQTALCALSGPLAGVLLYFLLLPFNEAYAQVSLMLSLLNLLPVKSLDGGLVVYNITAYFTNEGLSRKIYILPAALPCSCCLPQVF
jgi:stage IV sporulation protein FB